MIERKSWRELRYFRRKIEEALKPSECPESSEGLCRTYANTADSISQELNKLYALKTTQQNSLQVLKIP
jgi:hypothetical protein